MMTPFTQQLEAQLPALKRYAMTLTRNAANAEDLVQDCAERAIIKQHLYQEGTNLKSWLFTMMRNLFISQIKKKSNQMECVALDDLPGFAKTPQSQQVHVEMKEFSEIMDTLSEDERDILMMAGAYGYSYEETAAALNLPVGTVKSRLFRARAKLQEKIKDEHDSGDNPLQGFDAISESETRVSAFG